MKKLAIALLACVAFGASAENKVGTLENVTGAVSVGGKGFVAKAVNGTPLVNGSTILVSSKGKATVVLAKGCSVTLQGSQHLTVNSSLTCEQAIASIKHMAAPVHLALAPISTPVPGAAAPVGGAGVATGGGGTTIAVTTFGAALLGMVANDASKNDKSSGS